MNAVTFNERRDGISVEGLKIVTGEFTLDIADWHAPAGSCVAIIGANGAGKSTLLEAMLGLRKAERISAKMLGLDVARWNRDPHLRKRLGVLLQRTQLPYGLRVRDIVKLHQGLYGRTSAEVREVLGIDEIVTKRYDQLSSGQMQRTELFMALAHLPDLLFMDEPLNALDHRYAAAVCELVATMQHSTVMMACHRANELELADIALWVRGGQVVAAKPPEVLRSEKVGDFRLNVAFENATMTDDFCGRLHAVTTPRYLRRNNEKEVTVYGEEQLIKLARDLLEGDAVEHLEFGRTSLSDLLYYCAQVTEDA